VINDYGWSDRLRQDFAPFEERGFIPARVLVQQRGRFTLATEAGEIVAELAGRFAHEAGVGQYPAAGDWVACAVREAEGAGTIHGLVPRHSAFTRKGANGVQVVAANIDVALLTTSLNADFSLRRLERYLANTYECGATPVIVLTKADLADDVDGMVAEAEAIAFGVPVIAVSSLTGEGLDDLREHLKPGETAVVLGMSGTGKSTLVNALAGAEIMVTQAIIEEGARGKHTTTHRELVRLPSGALMLDTPGMREIGVFGADEGVDVLFGDIDALAGDCRFSNCRHEREPGCAIRVALKDGALDEGRWRSYVKLQKELAFEARKEDHHLRLAAKQVWVQRTKANRVRMKFKGAEE
jgi:ribosome biogenesis GTPase